MGTLALRMLSSQQTPFMSSKCEEIMVFMSKTMARKLLHYGPELYRKLSSAVDESNRFLKAVLDASGWNFVVNAHQCLLPCSKESNFNFMLIIYSDTVKLRSGLEAILIGLLMQRFYWIPVLIQVLEDFYRRYLSCYNVVRTKNPVEIERVLINGESIEISCIFKPGIIG